MDKLSNYSMVKHNNSQLPILIAKGPNLGVTVAFREFRGILVVKVQR